MRRLLTWPTAVIAAVLATLAVLVAIQSSPTLTAPQARAVLLQDVTAATGAAFVAEPDQPCAWFELAGAPADGKVRPQLRLVDAMAPAGVPVLDALAARLGSLGWQVTRPGGGLQATDPAGRRLSSQVGGPGVTASGPCVWPDGERRPPR